MKCYKWITVMAVVVMVFGCTLPLLAQDATTGNSPSAAAPPPPKTVSASLGKVDGVDATDNPCTTSTTFVDMPGMSVSFLLGSSPGQARSRVVVMFQGEWIPNTGRALLRLLIDGVVQSGPGDDASPFAPHEGTSDMTNGFNFISDPQTANTTHTATIQWATTADQICVDERSFLVFHK